jgi:hypothetical protein
MNEHIVDYLNYYIELENPQYAVLLIGNWGCGKTYFIKDLIKQWIEPDDFEEKVNLKPIYVSLNGIADTNTINERIRAVISPFLYSKGMKVAKSVLKGLLKTTAKIDLNFDDDDKSDGNISFNVDSLGIFDSTNKDIKGKRILIFDDIERCKIKTDEIFGYINNFVEHLGCKVILLTDEKKIKAKYENNKSDLDIDYKDFKEKLIGQTFEVKSDVNTAVNHFIIEGKKINGKLNLNEYKYTITELFISSKLENLRVLKQALLDFNRLTTYIDNEFQEHDKYDLFIKNLLVYFIIVYAEYKTGNDKIRQYQTFNYFNQKEDTALKEAEGKYNSILENLNVFHSSYVFSISSILSYIEKGFISKEGLNNELKSNTFFRKDQEQDWEKLWWWNFLDDDLFLSLRENVWQQFLNGEIKETTVVLHIAGIFITLINEKLIDKRKEYVVSKSKKILNDIFKNNKAYSKQHIAYGLMDSSWGKQYQALNSPEFIELKNYLDKKVKDTQSTICIDYMKELFEDLSESSIYLLSGRLKEPLPDGSDWYERTAIFKTVNGCKLGKRIKSFKTRAIFDFKTFIHNRYYPEERHLNVQLENYHKDDISCLVDLRTELEKKMKSHEKIKNRMLNALIIELEAIITKINQI